MQKQILLRRNLSKLSYCEINVKSSSSYLEGQKSWVSIGCHVEKDLISEPGSLSVNVDSIIRTMTRIRLEVKVVVIAL